MPYYDFQCPECAHTQEELVRLDESVTCEKCGTAMTRLMPCPHMLTHIVPTTKTSKRLKAGYQHQYVNQPATRTQVGYGGGITKGDEK